MGQVVDYQISNLGLPVLSPGDSRNWNDHKELFKTAYKRISFDLVDYLSLFFLNHTVTDLFKEVDSESRRF